MGKASLIYSSSEFPNGIFEIKRLSNQIRGQFKNFSVEVFAEGVIIRSDKDVMELDQKNTIDGIVSTHTGDSFDFLAKSTSDQRRFKIQEIIAMARDRADLSPYVGVILSYLNYRNKELDGHIYYSATDELIGLIIGDKEDGQPFAQLLNTIVTPADDEYPNGVKAYEFFIGKIQGVI